MNVKQNGMNFKTYQTLKEMNVIHFFESYIINFDKEI